MNRFSFSVNLKIYLDGRGMSQAMLARKTGLTEPAISHYVNATREPNFAALCKILRALDVKFEQLVK